MTQYFISPTIKQVRFRCDCGNHSITVRRKQTPLAQAYALNRAENFRIDMMYRWCWIERDPLILDETWPHKRR